VYTISSILPCENPSGIEGGGEMRGVRDRKEVVKHSAAVQIQNNITLLQRRAWNVLLANAYDELPTKEEYRISVRDLVKVLEYGGHNDTYLKEALEALVGCKVKWNILDKDNQWEWGVMTLLAQAKIKNGMCTYAYSPELRRRLHNPTMYARINLSMQNKFGSKYAQALWELCVDYLGTARQQGETPFIPVERYREIMGISAQQYPQFKEFNRRVIKEPVKEINRVTDFHVAVDYLRRGRGDKVIAMKFRIRRVLEIGQFGKRTVRLFPDLEDTPLVIKILKDAGLAAKDAWEIWQSGFDWVEADKRPEIAGDDGEAAFLHYVREKVDLLKRRQASGKVESSTGFLLEAIRKNYANPEFATAEQQKEAQRRHEAKGARERKLEQLRDEKMGLERARQDEVRALCKEMILTSPELAEEAAKALLQESSWFKKQYEPGKTAVENYLKVPALWIEMDRYLEERYSDRFRAIQEKYDAQLDAINKKISELEQMNT
jgi:Initiator Replication protein